VQQLAWQDLEQGALFQYNIGEYDEERGSYACGNTGLPPPPAVLFDAPLLNVTEWFQAVKSYGGTYAILTAQAGCGFLLYPTNTTLPDGNKYK
jgi:alpha-L-fucosidase